LLYTWQGSNPDLKPTTLMAHQDTVPVPADTVSLIPSPEDTLITELSRSPRGTTHPGAEPTMGNTSGVAARPTARTNSSPLYQP
jgi:hypothetical protein